MTDSSRQPRFRVPAVLLGLALAGLSVAAIAVGNGATPPPRTAVEQGSSALHNFWWGEAVRQFRLAQREDSAAFLPYWGEAMAYHRMFGFRGGQVDSMKAVLGRYGATPEDRAALVATPRERALLDAIEILIGEGDGETRHLAYSAEMKRVAGRFADDAEVQAFYLASLFGTVPSLRSDSALRLRAARVADRVLELDPHHPGGLHYKIHALDTPDLAHRIVDAADSYRRVVEGAPHAIHMPSHVYMQLGRWDDVIAANLLAYQTSIEDARRQHDDPRGRDRHAFIWLVYGHLQKGQYHAARALLDSATRLRTADSTTMWTWGEAQVVGRYLVDSENWWPGGFSADSVWADDDGRAFTYDIQLSRAINAIGAGEIERARGILTLMREFAAAADEITWSRSIGYRWEAAIAEVTALVALSEGNVHEVLRAMDRAVAAAAKLPPPNEDPSPIKPPHELYGEILLRLDRPTEAAAHFAESLESWRNRPRSILGLARAHAAAGDDPVAREAYRWLLELWRDADEDVAELEEARRVIGE